MPAQTQPFINQPASVADRPVIARELTRAFGFSYRSASFLARAGRLHCPAISSL